MMDLKPKTISKSGVAKAISKALAYRYLREPEETESICRDILAVQPDHQEALRLLGLAITDQFTGNVSDRYAEAESVFQSLTDRYERLYYTGLLHERQAKAQVRAGRPLHTLVVLFENAMACFEQAEKIRQPDNEETILRWNRCVRILQALPGFEEKEVPGFEAGDSSPVA